MTLKISSLSRISRWRKSRSKSTKDISKIRKNAFKYAQETELKKRYEGRSAELDHLFI